MVGAENVHGSPTPLGLHRLTHPMKTLALFLSLFALTSGSLEAVILVKIPGVPGTAKIQGYDDGNWFVADSFSFGVERELTESVKGGTEDINIGVGELQECTISKSMDRGSAKLAQFAINGNTAGQAEIHFVQLVVDPVGGGTKAIPYLIYKLDRCFVKSWSTSGDADDRPTEEVAFHYNRIAFAYYHSEDGRTFEPAQIMSWDNVQNKPWSDHGLPANAPMGGK